ELARSLRIGGGDARFRLKFDEAAERVAGDLAEKAAVGAAQDTGVPEQQTARRLDESEGRGRRRWILIASWPGPCGERHRDFFAAAEAGASAAAASVEAIDHGLAGDVEKVASRADQQGVPGGVVPVARTVRRDRRFAFAGRHQSQPGGDAD